MMPSLHCLASDKSHTRITRSKRTSPNSAVGTLCVFLRLHEQNEIGQSERGLSTAAAHSRWRSGRWNQVIVNVIADLLLLLLLQLSAPNGRLNVGVFIVVVVAIDCASLGRRR
jgi:hypothetical protein